jgi:Fe-S cluster assembly ATPase SufC
VDVAEERQRLFLPLALESCSHERSRRQDDPGGAARSEGGVDGHAHRRRQPGRLARADGGQPTCAFPYVLEAIDAIDFLVLAKERMKLVEMDPSFMKRSVNEGFSGGEKKRNEILQMTILEPKLAILDETDSGLDYSPILLLKPFGFRITPDTLSSNE